MYYQANWPIKDSLLAIPRTFNHASVDNALTFDERLYRFVKSDDVWDYFIYIYNAHTNTYGGWWDDLLWYWTGQIPHKSPLYIFIYGKWSLIIYYFFKTLISKVFTFHTLFMVKYIHPLRSVIGQKDMLLFTMIFLDQCSKPSTWIWNLSNIRYAKVCKARLFKLH